MKKAAVNSLDKNLIYKKLPGAEKVISWFGEWPSFHDAEVLELHMDRRGQSWVKVHTWGMVNQVDATGQRIPEKSYGDHDTGGTKK